MKLLLAGLSQNDDEIISALPACNVVVAEGIDELIEHVYSCSPDAIIVNGDLSGIWEMLQQIANLLPLPVLIITAEDTIDADTAILRDTNTFAYLTRPLSAKTMQCQLNLACTLFERLMGARFEAEQLRQAFAARKLIDRAKGMVMLRKQCSEGDAYTYLREESRRQRTPIADIAKCILNEVDQLPRISVTPVVGG